MLCGAPVLFPHKGYWEYNEFWYHLLKHKENVLLIGKTLSSYGFLPYHLSALASIHWVLFSRCNLLSFWRQEHEASVTYKSRSQMLWFRT